MLFSLLPTAALIVAAWAAAAGPQPPGDGMPELRRHPHPDLHDEAALTAIPPGGRSTFPSTSAPRSEEPHSFEGL